MHILIYWRQQKKVWTNLKTDWLKLFRLKYKTNKYLKEKKHKEEKMEWRWKNKYLNLSNVIKISTDSDSSKFQTGKYTKTILRHIVIKLLRNEKIKMNQRMEKDISNIGIGG